ncbi:hypothetical protein LTR66_016343 [Elasticomyces elasticus]|nr:hypothetical protein LTR66_016343 [Elasticomyces elasticus]
MSLGSIAHLQYYFARTGLLDGRAGQNVKRKENGQMDIPKVNIRSSSQRFDDPAEVEEESELLYEAMKEEGEEIMLPPTVSTYSNRPIYVPPPPSQQTMKRELVDSLENALHALHAIEASENSSKGEEDLGQGFYELEGLNVLDATTLAIRAARQYYTQHPNAQRLNSIKPDNQLRNELYDVLEVLKTAAGRNFSGGFREHERLSILVWVSDIGMMIDQEAKLDDQERRSRRQWQWLDGSNWHDCDPTNRELDFISFLQYSADIPENDRISKLGDEFWLSLVDGRQLIKLHNAAVKKSKRQFGYIEKCHDDVAKPYRRAENLRFWLKAAELRFETKLKLEVMATVSATDESTRTLKDFESTVLAWAKGVRLDLTKDWNGDEEKKLHARARSLALASPTGSPKKPFSTSGSPLKESLKADVGEIDPHNISP